MQFVRKEDDIHTERELSLVQAMCGDNNIQVESLDGNVTIKVAAGTQNNDKIVVKNRVKI